MSNLPFPMSPLLDYMPEYILACRPIHMLGVAVSIVHKTAEPVAPSITRSDGLFPVYPKSAETLRPILLYRQLSSALVHAQADDEQAHRADQQVHVVDVEQQRKI